MDATQPSQTPTTRGRPPSISREETPGRIQAGLGTSRYKEYDIAPYAQITHVSVPQELWSAVFFAWMSMKGHLQGLHGFDRTEAFATRIEDVVYAVFIVVWDNPTGMGQWLEGGYPVEEMLRKMGIASDDMDIQLMRDFA